MPGGHTSTKAGVVLLVVSIAGLPGAAIEIAGLEGSAAVWWLGATTALTAVIVTGWRVTGVMGLALAASTVGAGLVAGDPWLALLLMGAAAATAGFTSRWGYSQGLAMAPITLGFLVAEPPTFPAAGSTTANALLMGLVMLMATGWGLAIGALIGRRIHLPHPTGIGVAAAALYAAVLGLLVGVAAWFVIDRQLGHGGAWLMMTILIIVQPYLKDTWSKTWQRGAGTILGFVIAFAIASLVSSTWLLAVLGLAFVFAAIWSRMRKADYWVYVSMLTPAIVILEGSSGSVVDTDVRRLTFTLIGTAVSFAAMAVLVPVLRAVSRHRARHRPSVSPPADGDSSSRTHE